MSMPKRLILLALLVLLVPAAGYLYITKRYLAPRAELSEDIARAYVWIEQTRSYLDTERRIRRDLAAYAARTLGETEEEVEHALRSTLNDLGARTGLARLTVDTNMRGGVGSPAAAARVSEFQQNRALRDRTDYHRAEATLTGTGTLEQVLRTIHELQSLPWLMRIDSIDLSARDNGTRFELRLRLTTLYFRDLSPAGERVAHLTEGSTLSEPVQLLAARNVFHLPAPKPREEPRPAPVAQAPAPVAPPPPPYDDWSVTGIAHASGGPELWLTNRKSSERRVLLISQRILGATFVGLTGDPERAVVEIDGQRFLVRLGATLAERTPLENVSMTEYVGEGSPALSADTNGAPNRGDVATDAIASEECFAQTRF